MPPAPPPTSAPASLPVASRVYQHHSLDSTRWNRFVARDGDIVVASSYKAGTTWVQLIVLHLLGHERPQIDRISPWLEFPGIPIRWVLESLERQTGRRVIKTHLPLDGLVYHEKIHYIVVGRDTRDVFMSLWNHYQHLVPVPFLSRPYPGQVGGPLPPCPRDIRVFWREWITCGWFPREQEGYPFWGNLRHTATWWQSRHLSNIHFVHFNDLLIRPVDEIGRIARQIEADASSSKVADVANATSFANVKRNARDLLPGAEATFRGGARSFIHRGTNRRWVGVLTDEDLELYSGVAGRELSPECREWLETGRRR